MLTRAEYSAYCRNGQQNITQLLGSYTYITFHRLMQSVRKTRAQIEQRFYTIHCYWI